MVIEVVKTKNDHFGGLFKFSVDVRKNSAQPRENFFTWADAQQATGGECQASEAINDRARWAQSLPRHENALKSY